MKANAAAPLEGSGARDRGDVTGGSVGDVTEGSLGGWPSCKLRVAGSCGGIYSGELGGRV